MHSIVTPTQSLSFCIKTFSASPTNRRLFQSQSHDCSCYVIRRIRYLHRSDRRSILTSVPATARTVLICDIGLDSLTLPPSEAGEVLELICTGTSCCTLYRDLKNRKLSEAFARFHTNDYCLLHVCPFIRLHGNNSAPAGKIFCEITHTHICIYMGRY